LLTIALRRTIHEQAEAAGAPVPIFIAPVATYYCEKSANNEVEDTQ
jgi:hypothetical protein